MHSQTKHICRNLVVSVVGVRAAHSLSEHHSVTDRLIWERTHSHVHSTRFPVWIEKQTASLLLRSGFKLCFFIKLIVRAGSGHPSSFTYVKYNLQKLFRQQFAITGDRNHVMKPSAHINVREVGTLIQQHCYNKSVWEISSTTNCKWYHCKVQLFRNHRDWVIM